MRGNAKRKHENKSIFNRELRRKIKQSSPEQAITLVKNHKITHEDVYDRGIYKRMK
ncbi:hypothetical protein KAR50_00235 [Periweissella fabaria]|uniref:Uncharacterized protein n=1 Tax=Periweissella fabaria TaxID=546157 RepID=A0ABM8Z552_9LACO|nr:hypothetical protein [Periweissella fabaria]MCM0596289.1 hypothetical protein [Periweissella fabaria]CAH0415956.1 hypothetical protein WFA24289_00255 [Periweissella fabaria]